MKKRVGLMAEFSYSEIVLQMRFCEREREEDVWYSKGRLETSARALEGLDGVGSGDLVGLGASVFGGIAVHFHQLGQVEFRLLKYLDLADEDVFQWVDGVGLLFDLSSNRFRVGDPTTNGDKKQKIREFA